jgi:hypothetical protein
VRDTFAEAHREISADLTPEQKTKLEQMRRRHRRWMHRMHKGEAGELESPTP